MTTHRGWFTRPDSCLLPFERKFAAFVLNRQQTRRTPAVIRLEQNYGPEGIAFGAAAILLGLLGGAVGGTGIVFLIASNDHGDVLLAGYVSIFVGMAVALVAVLRTIQGICAGRGFRGDRPFVGQR